MFVSTKTLVVIASCALIAHAQSTSRTTTAPASQSSAPSGISDCVLGCVATAAPQGGCLGIDDTTCLCTSTAFQAAAQQCLANCSQADQQAALALQQQQCSALSSGASTAASTAASGTASKTGTSSASRTATSASTAASGTTSKAGTSSASKIATSASASASRSATSSSAAMALSAPISFGNLFSTLVASAGALVGAAFVL